MTESEMVISHNLICQKQPVPYGCVHTWHSAPHEYSNKNRFQQSILCIDSPAFIPTDEILVDGKPVTNIRLFSSQQQIILTTNPSQFYLKSSAVLIFAFNLNNELLFVNHKKRGWELPGGKIEVNENERQACIRETFEESYCELEESSLQPIAQYKIIDKDNVDDGHIKSVYAARVKLEYQDCHFDHETKDRKFVSSLDWLTILNENCSLLLHDDVYPICLEIAQHKLIISTTN
ncbi:unnamed protein product [Rotaria sordida]|uniref:Nudix hydrolase domain-containing protein n=1 Tax=Rotaria sordida TaxID=392033 RepID=A0A815JER7_9BILA|nr:unnamed protein product [Rotaria sordida]